MYLSISKTSVVRDNSTQGQNKEKQKRFWKRAQAELPQLCNLRFRCICNERLQCKSNEVVVLCVQEWDDMFLQWDPADYGGLQTLRLPCHKLWLPDIVLYNK